MSDDRRPQPDEVDQLLLNAQLRDELEPFFDEAIVRVNVNELPTPVENEFLKSMLAWERAPVLPISQWFDPELTIPHPDALDDGELHAVLWRTIRALHSRRIILDFTDHLTDRSLYCLIYRDILPSPEKKIDAPHNYLHWDCCDASRDPELWLRHYASEEERMNWVEDLTDPLPDHEDPPYPRDMPDETT